MKKELRKIVPKIKIKVKVKIKNVMKEGTVIYPSVMQWRGGEQSYDRAMAQQKSKHTNPVLNRTKRQKDELPHEHFTRDYSHSLSPREVEIQHKRVSDRIKQLKKNRKGLPPKLPLSAYLGNQANDK